MNLQMLKKAMLAYVSAVKFIWSSIAYPLSIVGKKLMNLRGYRVYGNSVQDGTPTPDNPIEIESVGDLTEKNLFDKSISNSTSIKNETVNSYWATTIYNNENVVKMLKLNTEYTISYDIDVISVPTGDNITIDRSDVGFRLYSSSTTTTIISCIKQIQLEQGKTYHFTSNFTTPDAFIADVMMLAYANSYVGKPTGWYTPTVIFRNIQIEEGTTATEYEPYHKYKIPVVARGRNLIPMFTFKTFTTNGVTFTNNNDGTITLNGTPTGYAATPVISLPKSSLEVLRNNACVLTGFYNYQKNITLTLDARLNGSSVKTIQLYIYSYKDYATVDLRDVTFDSVRFSIKRQTDNQLIDNVTVKPFLEVGTTMPTSFEPYIAPVTTNIFLDEPLRKVGDYADYIDFEKQKVVRNVEVLDDTGTKTIDESLGVINPPTEETVNLPALPQFKGTTIYEVGTNIKPSGMEAKYC